MDGEADADQLVPVAAIGIDGNGAKHPLIGLIEGATENAAVV